MKKNLCLILASAFCILQLWANPSSSVKQYTLENGLSVFLLEDTSTPLVRMELAVRAGFSQQTKSTSGFFKLYTRIVNETVKDLSLDSAECRGDSANYILTMTPDQLPQISEKLAKAVFATDFSDDLLTIQLGKLKQEVRANASSDAGFINAAIDSRVFSDAPWKHDSGVYPSLFARTNNKQARTILQTISQKYYTPQNSALFISGNINSEKTLELLSKTFGCYYSTAGIPSSKPGLAANSKRKFVIHSSNFSADLTQIVIQYTALDSEEAEITSLLLDSSYSQFKTKLLSLEQLNIPGDEYINAADASKKDCSRLIIQALMQPPEDKKLKTTSVQQAETFIEQTKQSIQNISAQDFFAAQQYAIFNLNSIQNSSTVFMEKLSDFWSYEPYTAFSEKNLENSENSILVENLLAESTRLSQTDYGTLVSRLNSEEPFVFVIINSSDYKKNKKEYDKAGFEEINTKNAPWYSQDLYEKILDPEEEVQETVKYTSLSSEENFYEKNIEAIKKATLTNGIPVVTKQNLNSKGMTILLSIKGGKLKSSDDNGFEEVMINLLAGNIQTELYRQQYYGYILGAPEVTWNTGNSTSTITIQCDTEDCANICKGLANAIIYGDILPANADRAVNNRQYKKRLENGSAVRQLFCEAVNQLYPDTVFSKVYEAKNDILEKTNYTQILSAYPELLDAGRYSVIVTGNFDGNTMVDLLNSTLGMLSGINSYGAFLPQTMKIPENKEKIVKITHTFLTDVPAEKAGPMPAVLVPTTEFLDPVIYCLKSPAKGTKEEVLFNSLMYYAENLLQKEIDGNSRLKGAKVEFQKAYSQMDFASLVIQNVPHTKELDSAYESVLDTVKENLQGVYYQEALQTIKNLWTKKEMTQTVSNTGTAELLQEGLEALPQAFSPEYYLEQYNTLQNALITDYIKFASNIDAFVILKVYSQDGKK